MNNFKWGLVAAISAFLISVLLGILFKVNISFILIRALIFTVIFFGLGFGLRFAINSYFPEILSAEGAGSDYGQADDEQANTRINIVMDNTGEYAVPELYKTPDNPQEMGDIDELIMLGNRPRSRKASPARGIDADTEAGYNNTGDSQDFSFGEEELPAKFPADDVPYTDSDHDSSASENAAAGKPAFTPSLGEDDGLGGLPDLDMMARAFSGFGGAPQAAAPSAAASSASFVPTSFSEMEEIETVKPPARNTGNKPEPMKGDFSPKELAEGIRAVLSKDK